MLRSFSTILCAVLWLGGCAPLVEWICTSPDHVTTLSFPPDGQITITADACWEVSRGLYYTVQEGHTRTVPRSFFSSDGGNDDAHDYTLAFAAQGTLVALVDDGAVEVLYDTSTQESWPHLLGHETLSDPVVRQKWAARFALLRAASPDLPVPRVLSP